MGVIRKFLQKLHQVREKLFFFEKMLKSLSNKVKRLPLIMAGTTKQR